MNTDKSPISNIDKSIAVLPFVNMSTDPENEYFSDGITEEIINALTRIKGLKVIARTSSFAFKGKNMDVRDIGQQLGVSTILEGSVRKSQNRVRITAQLINTSDGSHLWAENFDRELVDIFALQDEVSLLIADQIRENFGHFYIQDQLIEPPTKNVDAYTTYLKARFQHLKWDSEGIGQAIVLYRESIGLDPSFSWPYFGLAYTFAMHASWAPDAQSLKLAEDFLDQGFQLDPHSEIGYFCQATINFWGKWDIGEAIKSYQKAIEINPAYTEAEEGLVELYSAIGAFDQAMEHVQHILMINPLSPNHYFTKGNIHYLKGEIQRAKIVLEAALEMDPNFSHVITKLQICLIILGDWDGLKNLLLNPNVEHPEVSRTLYQLIHPETGLDIDLISAHQQVDADPRIGLLPWKFYLLIAEKRYEEALDHLETAISLRTGQYMNVQFDPMLRPLRSNPGFKKLMSQVFSGQSKAEVQRINKPSPGKHVPQERVGQEKKQSTALMSQDEAIENLNRLKKELETDALYLDSDISLRSLAEKLGLSPNKLSWLINDQLDQNFNECINTYRLEAFKQKVLDPQNEHLTLLAIAYESGFNSKSVFNTFFKKQEGLTPKAWVKGNR